MTAPEPRDSSRKRPLILLVDDAELVRAAARRALTWGGFDTVEAPDVESACTILRERHIDVVISDLEMPRRDGIDLLRAVREHDPLLPVIILTGRPTVQTAMEAVQLDAFRYLTKPLDRDEVVQATRAAVKLHRASKIQHEALAVRGLRTVELGQQEEAFDRALTTLSMVYQPLLSAWDGHTVGHEALMRSEEPGFHPGVLLSAAERFGRVIDLGRRTRRLAAAPASKGDCGLLFVNLHPQDLGDADLLEGRSPLTSMAHRVVLEITERQALEHNQTERRLAKLRELGYRIAIDDLGAGYASLNSFATLAPDFVKLDMALVRGVDSDPLRQRLIRSLIDVSHDSGMIIVAEGVETVEEQDTLCDLGIDLLQGFLFARPGPAFPTTSWKRRSGPAKTT